MESRKSSSFASKYERRDAVENAIQNKPQKERLHRLKAGIKRKTAAVTIAFLAFGAGGCKASGENGQLEENSREVNKNLIQAVDHDNADRKSVKKEVEKKKQPVENRKTREKKKSKPAVYIVKKGDTLWDIADDTYHNPWKYKEIAKTNHIDISDPRHVLIETGQKLLLPHKIEHHVDPVPVKKEQRAYEIYTVKKGDTVSEIAQKEGESIVQIARANHLKDANIIHVGQKLKIPTGAKGKVYDGFKAKASHKSSVPSHEIKLPNTHVEQGDIEDGTQAQVIALIRKYWPDIYENQAISVAYCESGWGQDEYNEQNTAANGEHAEGVFQFIPSTWQTTTFRNESAYNDTASIRAAYELFKRDGYSWREWACKP